MILEFVDFCEELFPSISPYTAKTAKRALSQFKEIYGIHRYTTLPLDKLSQGDIFSEIWFPHFEADGSLRATKTKVQLISNTCDSQRDDSLIFAAVREIKDYSDKKEDIWELKQNLNYKFMFIPGKETEELYVDLSVMHAIPRIFLNLWLERGSVKKIASLSRLGFYMFICKLTVFFMRPEDPEHNEKREVGTCQPST